MKKLFMLLALVLGVVSCQTEPEGFGVVVGGEQDVNITVSLPESTRGDSADGFDLSKLSDLGYELRYILEIYLDGGDDNKRFREVKYSDATTVSFPVRLAPSREYHFAVWADLVKKVANRAEGENADNYYVTSAGLKNITIDVDKWTPNVEARDAFYGKAALTMNQSIANLPTIKLTRPFAKVRVVATDYEDIRKFGIEPDNATVSYVAGMCKSFNAVEGTAGDPTTTTTSINYDIVKEAYSADADAGQLTVFADYILVPASGTVQFTLNVNAANGLIKSNSFNTAIPVEANKVTSIVGDVLTEGGNVSIKIDGTLGQKETINYVDTAEDLQEIIAGIEDGGSANIELGGNIDLNVLLGAGILSTRAGDGAGIVIPANTSVVLDLNGFTISQTKTQTTAYSMIQNLGALTIKDSSTDNTGKLNYTDNGQGGNYVSNTIQNSGVLTIDGGTIENSSSATVASNGYPHPIDNSGTLTINGGTFTNNANYNAMRIWCTTDDDTIVTIKGGTFNGSIDFQTPNASANKGTLTIEGGTFNADTYTKCAVRLLGFGADVDEMNGYIRGGQFNGAIALRNWSGNELNSKVFDITGGTFTTAAKEGTDTSLINDDYAWVEAENGLWNVVKAPIAQVGTVVFDTSIEDAVAAAKAGDTITLLKDITITTGLTLPADVIFNGNGKQIDGSISAGGNLTFVGHTKVTSFSASYYDRVITIGEGACLEITGVGRVTLGYGNTFNITGSVENAKNADKANIQPSLIIPGGISITGGNNATMNVTNAYVYIGSTSSKNSAANGTFTINIENSIAEFTNQLTFAEPTEGKKPTFNVNIKDSILTTGTKLILAAPDCNMNVDNSTINISTYFGNSGIVTLTNGSELTGSCIQDNEGINHRGSTTVDNSTFTINATSTGHAFNGRNEGSITARNNSHVTVTYYKGITISVDESSTFTGTDIDGNKKIHYVSEEMKLEPTNPDALGGATIVSNVWDKTTGKGVITFDRDLTIIGDKAFQRVTNTTPSNWATSITLPNSVTTIGDFAFYMCYSLKTVTIPESVRSIGQYAFGSCNDLVEINCQPTTPPTLGYGAFNNVSATCYVPTGSVDTYKANWSEYEGNIEGREF